MFAKFADKEYVSKLLNKGALLVDMRSPIDFRNGSVDGAVNLPLKNFLNKITGLNKKTKIIVFGDTKNDIDIITGINYAVQLGFTDIFVSEYNQLKETD
jgi:3-mercaptopyruvate sulfurtransferase SseA